MDFTMVYLFLNTNSISLLCSYLYITEYFQLDMGLFEFAAADCEFNRSQ